MLSNVQDERITLWTLVISDLQYVNICAVKKITNLFVTLVITTLNGIIKKEKLMCKTCIVLRIILITGGSAGGWDRLNKAKVYTIIYM
jgi:hypothetical protein